MKCPVCKNEILLPESSCPQCGFNQLRTDFLSREDGDNWIQEVVLPEKTEWIIKCAKQTRQILIATILAYDKKLTQRIISEFFTETAHHFPINDVSLFPCIVKKARKSMINTKFGVISCSGLDDADTEIEHTYEFDLKKFTWKTVKQSGIIEIYDNDKKIVTFECPSAERYTEVNIVLCLCKLSSFLFEYAFNDKSAIFPSVKNISETIAAYFSGNELKALSFPGFYSEYDDWSETPLRKYGECIFKIPLNEYHSFSSKEFDILEKIREIKYVEYTILLPDRKITSMRSVDTLKTELFFDKYSATIYIGNVSDYRKIVFHSE